MGFKTRRPENLRRTMSITTYVIEKTTFKEGRSDQRPTAPRNTILFKWLINII